MLAGMSSLATLAHTAAAPPPFDATYYATIATVIPVLFLAIAVQGGTYGKILQSATRAIRGYKRERYLVYLAAAVVSLLLAAIAFLIVIAGGYGEVQAIHALYQQHDDRGVREQVYLAAIFLIIAAAGGPLLIYTRVIFATMLLRPGPWLGDEPDSPEPGTKASPETGKTGTEASPDAAKAGKTDPEN